MNKFAKNYFAVGVIFASIFIFATQADATEPNTLPSPPSGPKERDLKQFRLHEFVAKDAAGHRITGVPATLIDVFSGLGEWESVSPDKVPPFTYFLPDDMRDQIQLFYMDDELGWILVPRGWKVHRAAEGADGTERFTFVAPTGAKYGWLDLSYVPGCMGCMYWDTDGLIPDAHKGLIDMGLAAPSSKPAKLVPTPDSISHPDPHTAIFRYHISSSPPVRAMVFLGPETQEGDVVERALYLALPTSKTKLVDCITDYYFGTGVVCNGVD
ncbi:MAG: DUF4850 domain-containing protein [Gammaproteobacteria bacterium]